MPNVVTMWLPFLLYTQEVLGSNPGPENIYADRLFSVSWANARLFHKLDHSHFLLYPFQFMNHPIFHS